MKKLNFFIILFAVTSLCAVSDESRVNSLIIIKDYCGAAETAAYFIKENPNSQALWLSYIQALAKCGDEKKMIGAWKNFISYFPDENLNRKAIESLAWGVIEKSAKSTAPMLRIYAAISAMFAEDALGVEIVKSLLYDRNHIVRAATLQLASNLRDSVLQEEVLKILQSEKNYIVRLEAVKASGKMKIKRAKPYLFNILEKSQGCLEEKLFAIEALAQILDDIDRNQILGLSNSKRAPLRELACECVAALDKTDDIDLILPLLEDHSHFVRQKAIYTLGLLKIEEYQGKKIVDLIYPLTFDCNLEVVATAAYALLNLGDIARGEPVYSRLLNNSNQEIRLMASASLVMTGSNGYPLIEKAFTQAEDHFVKMNLAIGLIGQRMKCGPACRFLKNCLVNDKCRWSWDNKGAFSFIRLSNVKHSEMIPNQPEMLNQLTRLEILNILAIMNEAGFEEAIENFLEEKNWSISGMASLMLLKEGDSSAIDVIKKQMSSDDPNKSFQAGLVLALWGREKDALSVLQESYEKANYEMKERILEGLCNIAAKESIPFLVECLSEQNQTLRIIAATAILRSLNS